MVICKLKVRMFSKLDLVIGAIGIRILRYYERIIKKPDIFFVKPKIGFGGYTNYDALAELGITSILDLRKEESKAKFSKNISYHKIGISNGSIPSEHQIIQIKKWFKEKLNNSETIFIHCNLGRGRATLVTSLYFAFEGYDFNSIIKLVKKRKFVYLNKKQLECLKNYIS